MRIIIMRTIPITLGLVALSMAIRPSAPAATIHVPASADTALFQNNPDHNLGALEFLPIGVTSIGDYARGLIRFDLTGNVPFGAVVTEAALDLTVVQGRFSTDVYQVHRLLRDWGEGDKTGRISGTGLGAPADSGEATWLARFHPNVLWASPGGLSGVDFAGSPSASQNIANNGLYTFSSPQLAADVAQWLTHPATNHGWIILVENEIAAIGSARRFASRQDLNPANHPRLTITYTVPGCIENPQVVGDQFQFEFLADPNHAYAVQRQDRLKSGLWTTITNIPAPQEETLVQITDVLAPGPRFYRIELE